MKKFIFSAIAMVAFVGSSMANTIELENKNETIVSISQKPSVDNIEESHKKQSFITLKDNCGGVWSATRIYALNQGFKVKEADCIAMAAYLTCIGIADNAVNDRGIIC